MARKRIGTMTCPDCGGAGCEVNLDKGGNPYRVCFSADCDGAQWFTLGRPGRMRSVLAKMTPAEGVDLSELYAKAEMQAPGAPKAAAKPPAKPVPEPAPARKSFTLLGRRP